MSVRLESVSESVTRVPGRVMGGKVSHDDVVNTGVEKKVKGRLEIGKAGGDKGDVNIVDVDGISLMPAVIERCSVLVSLSKKESVGRRVYEFTCRIYGKHRVVTIDAARAKILRKMVGDFFLGRRGLGGVAAFDPAVSGIPASMFKRHES